MARKRKDPNDKKHTVRDYIIYFVCAFVLIFLTSSFVMENIYNNAGNITVSPEGVKQIYLSATGQLNFNEVNSSQTETKKDTTETEESGSEQQSTEQQTNQQSTEQQSTEQQSTEQQTAQ